MRKFYAILVMLIGLAVLAGCSSHTAISSVPAAQASAINMDGKWTQTKGSGLPGVSMSAVVAKGTIKITMTMDDNTSGLYWDGTFVDTWACLTYTSKADTSAMKYSLYASQDSAKTFMFNSKTGNLSYHFSFLGVYSDVHLQRSSE